MIYLPHMNTILSLLVERISQLPETAQAEATRALLDVQNRNSIPLTLSATEHDFVQEGTDAYERGEWMTNADAVASFRKIVTA
jgi:hypothetical protein